MLSPLYCVHFYDEWYDHEDPDNGFHQNNSFISHLWNKSVSENDFAQHFDSAGNQRSHPVAHALQGISLYKDYGYQNIQDTINLKIKTNRHQKQVTR